MSLKQNTEYGLREASARRQTWNQREVTYNESDTRQDKKLLGNESGTYGSAADSSYSLVPNDSHTYLGFYPYSLCCSC